jgi:hypothetical protein
MDFVFFALWLLLYIPLSVSNRNLQESTALVAMFHTFLPVFVVLYKMDQHSRRKTLGLFLILFDIFILLLLIIGVEEYLSGKYLLRAIRDWMAGLGLDTAEYNLFVDDHRFGFIWGHPLSNALFFNSFFVLNVVYLRSAGRKCPAPLFFAVALAGVLLSSSKTGITVCFLLLIVTNWKYKKWFLLIIPVLAVLYFLGAFNGIITRFTSTDLTTGRLEALEGYFSTGVSPFRLLSGYSSNMVFRAAEPAHPYRYAFEFPFLMFAFDYGILYSLVWVGGLYLYAAIRFLRKKKVFAFLCFTLLFAQTNTYNGLALRNQDFCLYCCFITMMLINMAEMDPKPPEQSK